MLFITFSAEVNKNKITFVLHSTWNRSCNFTHSSSHIKTESKANKCSSIASSLTNCQLQTGIMHQTKTPYLVPCDVTFSVTCSPMANISYRRLDARSTKTSNGLVSATHTDMLTFPGLWKVSKENHWEMWTCWTTRLSAQTVIHISQPTESNGNSHHRLPAKKYHPLHLILSSYTIWLLTTDY